MKGLLPLVHSDKFQQNLHLFRAYELPQLVTATNFKNYVMWQCIIDEVVKSELQLPSPDIITPKPTRILTAIEENAVRFAAGFVIKKLLEKCCKDSAKIMCLKGLLKSSNDEEVYDSQSEIWLNKIDRGYLKHINDIGYEFFIELEISTYDALTGTDSKELEALHDIVCKDEDVVRIWSMCVEGIGDTSTQQSLLQDIVKEWIKV